MNEVQREIRKTENGKILFVTKTEDMLRTEETTTDKAKEVYDQTMKDKQSWMENLQKINKFLKEQPELDEDTRLFIERLQKAEVFKQVEKATKDRETALDMIERCNKQLKDLENVIPELKR